MECKELNTHLTSLTVCDVIILINNLSVTVTLKAFACQTCMCPVINLHIIQFFQRYNLSKQASTPAFDVAAFIFC